MPTPQIAGHINRSRTLFATLTYQCAVNALILARGIRERGRGGLLTPAELQELDVAFETGITPEQFVDRLTARMPAPRIAEAS